MNLPQFTFLSGTTDEFNRLLVAANPHASVFEFFDRINTAMGDLCLDSQPAKRAAFVSLLRTLSGANHIGLLTHIDFTSMYDPDIQCFFFDSSDDIRDIESFAQLAKSKPLYIRCSQIPDVVHSLHVSILWLPQVEPQRQLQYVEHELTRDSIATSDVKL